MWYTSKKQYLSILRELCDQLPPLDTKVKRKAFYATSGLIYGEAIKFGIECWITFKLAEARGEELSVEGIIRDNLAYSLAKLKFAGKVPPPIEMKLASLFDIKGWEIDECAEFFQDDQHVVNGTVPPEGFPVHAAEVVAFPAAKAARSGRSVERVATGAEADPNVIAFPARRIVRAGSPVKAA